MKRRTCKRTLLMVLLLLTGGAIINVAVAWGCAVVLRSVSLERFAPEPATISELWSRFATHDWPAAPQTSLPLTDKNNESVTRRVLTGMTVDLFLVSHRDNGVLQMWQVVHVTSGWPSRSLGGAWAGHDIYPPSAAFTQTS